MFLNQRRLRDPDLGASHSPKLFALEAPRIECPNEPPRKDVLPEGVFPNAPARRIADDKFKSKVLDQDTHLWELLQFEKPGFGMQRAGEVESWLAREIIRQQLQRMPRAPCEIDSPRERRTAERAAQPVLAENPIRPGI